MNVDLTYKINKRKLKQTKLYRFRLSIKLEKDLVK